MKRIVLYTEHPKPCPFCGCEKVFLKAFREGGYARKRFAVSGQCASCHVNGPQVFSDWQEELPYFEDLPEDVKKDLIQRALVKWNERH